ncbi:MAG TPA: dihydrolipoamide acetyltransferase family protein [Solirubrobacteraceae bacterium]|jgi:2-oxoglutarate dehydrogenase E2 component (dihydrolipoamide succinyltransferase)|nr:dihydrolipoamide acetyltransferase family protein [Solirubrobacteraceae bacterium]
MPQMGVSVVEGTLAAWHKAVGDRILADETICEISTDKIDTDIPSPADGRVLELAVAEGETVVVGTVLARLAVGASADGDDLGDMDPVAPAGVDPAPTVAAPAGDGESRRNHSPVVLRMAELQGIDLSEVAGTGRNGRISKQDIEAYLAQRPPAGPGPRGAEIEAVGVDGSERATVSEPLSRMRLAIAEHMTRSLGTAAHCTTVIEVDMSAIVRARRAAGLGLLPYVARCVAESLCVFGTMNATLEGDIVTRHGSVNLGIAVSLGERGLIVPVIERAQTLGVAELAERILDLGERARLGRLAPDEVRGGTFTITNPGRWGTTGGTPIINQPQVGILDLEAVVDRVVVLDGQSIGIRPMANLCLSFDHRAMDGNLAAEFLGDVRSRIEGWQE